MRRGSSSAPRRTTSPARRRVAAQQDAERPLPEGRAASDILGADEHPAGREQLASLRGAEPRASPHPRDWAAQVRKQLASGALNPAPPPRGKFVGGAFPVGPAPPAASGGAALRADWVSRVRKGMADGSLALSPPPRGKFVNWVEDGGAPRGAPPRAASSPPPAQTLERGAR